ncbi:MAG: Glutamine amidotransferase, class I [Ktedonobacterales bacterium]|jgi:putative glutamine amidotransferase|nr:MAG: Glutamine amidotransferase, class I [Ktedonobacterales bacterium]
MQFPVIGIPCYSTERGDNQRPIYANNQTYAQAIIHAGGAPVLIPPGSPDMLAAIYARLDGLLLSGGGDVNPAFYGEDPIPACQPPEQERDEAELALTRAALADGLPILGICRGHQLLNIALGGSLYQDIPTQWQGKFLRHDCAGEVRDHIAHSIQIAPGSQLASILGTTETGVNSFHHQALKALGAGLRTVATSEDGVIEGIELPDRPFVLAVQYHPEAMEATDPISRRLFAAFVRACAAHAEQRAIAAPRPNKPIATVQ